MTEWIRRNTTTVVVAMLTAALTVGGPAIASTIADYARNSDKVDGRHAVGAATSVAGRARADTVARQRRADSVAAIERASREARRLAAARGGRPLPPSDTTPSPKMKRVTVSAELFLTLEEALKPGTSYRLQTNTVRSLSGTVKSPARGFVTPREVVADSTDAPTRRPPS